MQLRKLVLAGEEHRVCVLCICSLWRLRQHFAELNLTRVMQDTLGTKRACVYAMVDALEAGHEVVIDRCNFDSAQRSTWIQIASQFGAQVIGLQLNIPLSECVKRAVARTDHPTLKGQDAEAVIRRSELTNVLPSSNVTLCFHITCIGVRKP